MSRLIDHPAPARYVELRISAPDDPISLGVDLTRDALAPFVLYERSGAVNVALGAAIDIQVTRDSIRYRILDGKPSELPTTAEPLDQVGELLAGCGLADWRAYGWLAFELSHLSLGLAAVPEDVVLAHFVVPEREVRLAGGQAWLRARTPEGLAALHEQVRRVPAAGVGEVSGGLVDELAGCTDYRRSVSSAVADIRANRLRKVVLSRLVPVLGRLDLRASYRAGRRHNTPARSFLFDTGELAAAGFSPETVLEAYADRTVATQPVAGTRAFLDDPDRDDDLREELLNDPKEIVEHAVSVLGAQEELREVCDPASVQVGEFMSVTRRGDVQHLASRVNGRLAGGQTAWRALSRVFPAVTVSGLPKPAAVAAIGRYEGQPRGLYGGAVLTADADGSLDAAVALRSVFRRGGQTWLRVGAGLVEQSEPEREAQETVEKLRSISRYLVAAARS